MTIFDDFEERTERAEKKAEIHELALMLLIKSGNVTLDKANEAIELAKTILETDDSPITIEEPIDAEG